jgi:magnesium chelatase subunit D
VVIRRTARALAALRERTEVHQDDLEDAFELAIDHRRSPDPDGGPAPPDPERDPFDDTGESTDESQRDGESVVEPRETENLRLPPEFGDPGPSGPEPILRPGGPSGDRHLDLAETLRSASRRALEAEVPLALEAGDLVFRAAEDDVPSLLLWILDTSASMARNAAIGFVKSVVRNHVRADDRNWTALVDFRGESGSTLVPPTRRSREFVSALESLPVGGETPLAAGLRRARSVLQTFRGRHQQAGARAVLVSDGRVDPGDTVMEALTLLKREAELTLVDAELGRTRWGAIGEMAARVGVQPVRLDRHVA